MRHYTWNGSKPPIVNTDAIDGYLDAATGQFHSLTPGTNNFALNRPTADSTRHAASDFRAMTSNNSFARSQEKDTDGDYEQGEGVDLAKDKVANLVPEVKKRLA